MRAPELTKASRRSPGGSCASSTRLRTFLRARRFSTSESTCGSCSNRLRSAPP